MLSSGIENQYQSKIDIDCYWLLSIISLSIYYAWNLRLSNLTEVVKASNMVGKNNNEWYGIKVRLRSFPSIALRIPTAHNFMRD